MIDRVLVSISKLKSIVDSHTAEIRHLTERLATVEKKDLQQEFIKFIKNAKGDKGDKGDKGQDGKDGKDGKQGERGLPGKDGLNGRDGKDGINGKDGADGKDGLSAYEVAVKEGYKGTEKEWLESLKAKLPLNYGGGIGKGAIAGYAGTELPKPNGTANVGTSVKYAREDHVHEGGSGGGAVNSVNGQTGDVILFIPSKTSDLTNDSNFISDVSYVHTDNNYTTTEKNKLAGIEDNANNYVHPSNHPPSIITQDASNRFVTDVQISSWNNKPSFTTADITYYVSTTGSDSNDGLSAGNPLRNIQTAINKIPQIVNHIVTIIVAVGTYSEDVVLSGFVGKGSINILGDTALSDNYKINSFTSSKCNCTLGLRGFRAITTTRIGFDIGYCTFIRIDYCKCIDSAMSQFAFNSMASYTWIVNCTASNKDTGVKCSTGTVLSANVSGTGNNNALAALQGGVIAKEGGQPSGTTAEFTTTGGVIR